MTSHSLPPLDIRCFGPPVLRVGGAEPPPDVQWRKHLALLVYLALSPDRTRSREHLLGLLWPEKEESRARHSLNEAIRRLRAGLGADRLRSHGDAVTLASENLSIDTEDPVPPAREFLEGLVIEDAPEFEHWVSVQRQRFRERAMDALLERGEAALAALDFGRGAEIARRALALDRASEPAVRMLMRASALRGDTTAALKAFREFERYLAEELHEAPGRELQALAERIRANRWRTVTGGGRHDAPPPLVGREREHALAFGELARAWSHGPRGLAVTAGPGMGRSRLLEECADRWRLDGGRVAVARPVEGDRDVSWSGVRELMRGGLGDAPGLAATDPTALRILAGVVPALAERFDPHEGMSRSDVADALRALLRAVAEEAPIALFVDDAHLADDESVAALRGVLSGRDALPVFVALGLPENVERTGPLERLLGEIGRGIPGSIVRLGPLREHELRGLVDALAPWVAGAEQRDRLTRRIAFETGGDPTFAVTLLEGLAEMASLREEALVWPPPNITLEAPVPFDVPHLVRVVTAARLRQLDASVRDVLVAAAIGDRAIEPDTVAALAERPVRAVEDALGVLERHGWVAFDGERYRLTARLIGSVVLSELVTPGQRRRLEQRWRAVTDRSP